MRASVLELRQRQETHRCSTILHSEMTGDSQFAFLPCLSVRCAPVHIRCALSFLNFAIYEVSKKKLLFSLF